MTENPLPRLSMEAHDDIRRRLREAKPFMSDFTMEKECHRIAMEAQREADWKRMEPLVEALELLADPASYKGATSAIGVKVATIAQVALAHLREETVP